jgi:23S rRNA-/tRNA-specific pseudouridylate synthase
MKIDAPPPATTLFFGVPITTFSLFSTSLPIRSTMTGSQGRPASQSARTRLLVLIWCSACSCFGFGWTFLPRFGRHPLSTNLSRGHGGRRQFLPASQVEEEEKTHGSIVDPLQAGEEAVLHEPLAGLPVGIPDSFRVVKQYHTAVQEPFQWDSIGLETSDVDRLELSPGNISLPVALMLFDSDEYPSFSRARKACRKGNILIHRGPSQTTEDETTEAANVFDAERCKKGRVGDRIFPGDVIGKQVRMGSGYFPVLGYKKPFDLPVVYEDDHCALVNKPSGVVVYSQKNGGHGSRTVRAALPFVLEPPVLGTYAVMRRPASVHRLDKPTSGVLCIAKTKPAMIHLSRQFHDRIIKKTYFAIVNGIPPETPVTAITPRAAFELGVDVDPDDAKGGWHLIDASLDGKHAVTVWRAVRYAKSLRAHDGYLTLVELKPKTGRYHQLRRHMAWECQCPLVGDGEYDEGTASAMTFRERGLFLCSTRVVLEHPYYNTEETRAQWRPDITSKFEECSTWLSEADRVMLTAQIALPSKFESLLNHEEQRYHKLEQ